MANVIRVDKRTSPFRQRKKVAAYARVSVEGENNEHSLQAQVSYYSKLISCHEDWEYAGIFSDYGITGTKTTRPGFQSMLKACEEGRIDCILAKSISRFARNTVDLLNVTRHLKTLGISVHFDRENIDTMSSDGELMLTLLASFAEEEAKSISDNTKWAVRKRFELGIAPPHQILGYRWDGNGYYIVEREAQIVRSVFAWYMEGLSPSDIADKLEASGFKAMSGSAFHYSTIWNMLRQEKYTGTAILQKTFYPDFITKKRCTNKGQLARYVVDDAYPQIISQELFDAVQTEIAERSTMGFMLNRNITISCFTSKVKCGICGASYRRQSKCHKSKSGEPQKKYYYWVCSTRQDKGGIKACTAHKVPESELYRLTSLALNNESFTNEDFRKAVSHITVEADGFFTFHMRDGSIIEISKEDNKDKEERLNA